jgi:hypothetical protein
VTAVLRDAVRHFCIDNDRVFLFGVGDGGSMAMDVGASHPDLFAGVLTMGGNPKWQNMFLHYWHNAQQLPFYVVTGELAGDAPTNLKLIYQMWTRYGFPGLMVVYKGRGMEWFGAEVPTMFDWMSRKKRVSSNSAALKLGLAPRSFPWRTMRTTDNRFYWIGVDASTRAATSTTSRVGPFNPRRSPRPSAGTTSSTSSASASAASPSGSPTTSSATGPNPCR